MEDNRQHIQVESFAEAEMDLDIRALQSGKGRRGTNASKSNGCCFDTVILQQFVAMGAMQQLSAFQGELRQTFVVPHQPAPVTMCPLGRRWR